uniref:Uncharacterized protein n=1 Tax=Anguilla anguilla TaxID=7936 RepID=A0A0E9SYW7_ANGAN
MVACDSEIMSPQSGLKMLEFLRSVLSEMQKSWTTLLINKKV